LPSLIDSSRPAALLALADGTIFRGLSIGAAGHTVGESCSTPRSPATRKILTDPSYCRQIVTLTYPHSANTGTNAEDVEADRVHAAGLIVRDLPHVHSSFRARESLAEYLRREGVVAIADIDTRRLTRILRDRGAGGAILVGTDEARAVAAGALVFPAWAGLDLAKVVTVAARTSGPRRSGRSAAATAASARPACTWSPTTSASSATSCACWPAAAAAVTVVRRRRRPPKF